MYDYKKILEELKQGSSKKESASNIGAIIRGARIERKMTQGEVAKGICSVSYLSKIENGLYDLKNAYVQEIMHRMDVKVDRHHTMDHTGIVNDVLMAVYHRDLVKLQSMRLRFEKPVVPAEWLVELAHHVLLKEEDKAAITFLNQNRRVLGKDELYLFLLLLAMHELQAYRIRDVAKLLDFLEMAQEDAPAYSVMSHFVLGRYYLLNGQYAPASHALSTALGLHGSVMRDAWRVDIMNHLLLVFVFGNEMPSAEQIVKQLVQLPSGSEWEEYAMGYYYMKKKEFDKALKSFLQAKELHFAPSMLGIVECCYLAGWHEKMRDYYHILDEVAPGTFFEKMANMFLLVIGPNLVPLKDYVTHILQPQFQLFGFYYYKQMAIRYLQEYFRSISRYKQVDLLRLEK